MCCISILNNSWVKPNLHAGRLPLFPLKSPFLHWWDNPAGAGGMFVPLSFWWLIFKVKWNIISNYNCNLHLCGSFFRLSKHQIGFLQYSILSYIPLIFIWRSSKCYVIESICKSTSLCLLPSQFSELASMIYIKCPLSI